LAIAPAFQRFHFREGALRQRLHPREKRRIKTHPRDIDTEAE
jgi:hypothetical protein